MKSLGLDDLMKGPEGSDLDYDSVLELAEVVSEYLVASEDQNQDLKSLKRKQFKQLYRNMFVEDD